MLTYIYCDTGGRTVPASARAARDDGRAREWPGEGFAGFYCVNTQSIIGWGGRGRRRGVKLKRPKSKSHFANYIATAYIWGRSWAGNSKSYTGGLRGSRSLRTSSFFPRGGGVEWGGDAARG